MKTYTVWYATLFTRDEQCRAQSSSDIPVEADSVFIDPSSFGVSRFDSASQQEHCFAVLIKNAFVVFLQQGPAAVTVRLTQRMTAPPAPAITLGLVRIMLATTFVSAPPSPTTPTPLASQAASRSLGCQHVDVLLIFTLMSSSLPQITTGPDSGTESCSAFPQHLLHCRTGTIYCLGLGSLSSTML